MAAGNGTNAARARRLERQAKALELRRMGKGYSEISAALGLSRSHAHRLVQAGLAEAKEQVFASAADLRAEELSRLDAMLSGLWPLARKGALGAVDRVLKVMERRAKLLGLDAPLRLAHGGDPSAPPINTRTLQTMSDEELERIAAREA
jgi:hypothetical protein